MLKEKWMKMIKVNGLQKLQDEKNCQVKCVNFFGLNLFYFAEKLDPDIVRFCKLFDKLITQEYL